MVGFAGLLDLGYIAFYAIGAYTTAYFTSKTAIPWHAPFVWNPFFIFPIAVIVVALAGVLLGGPTLRLRGDYLAIVTLGFGEIVYLLANNAKGITNGAARRLRGAAAVDPHRARSSTTGAWRRCRTTTCCSASSCVVMMAFSALNRSRTGRALAAIREDEVAAEAMGIPTLRYKLIAFAIGASVSGFAGVIFATEQFFDPSSFAFQNSILVLTVVIFGGMGSIFGVVLGAVVLQGLLYNLKDTVPAERPLHLLRCRDHADDGLPAAGPAAVAQTKSRDRPVRGRRRSCRRDADAAAPHDEPDQGRGRAVGCAARLAGPRGLGRHPALRRTDQPGRRVPARWPAAPSSPSSAPTGRARPRCSTA